MSAKAELPWGHWYLQARAVLRLEMRRIFRGKGMLLVLLMPVLPVFGFLMVALVRVDDRPVIPTIARGTEIFALVFQEFVLPWGIFITCLIVFTNLFRKEILDKTLHYLFLAPVKREVLAAGKFVAGVMAVSILFLLSTVVSYLLVYLPHGASAAWNHLLFGFGFAHLLAYLGVVALGVVGYGAVFLVTGLYFRNPFIPAVILLAWERLNPFLPTLLKKISVIHYLLSLCPVPVPQESAWAILGDPTPAWLAIPGFLVVTALVLLLAGRRIRVLEVAYGDE